MGYCLQFPEVIPHSRVDSLRVTNPFAAGLNPLDLHALSMLPAFTLSQDQTLSKKLAVINHQPTPALPLTGTRRTSFRATGVATKVLTPLKAGPRLLAG